MLGSRERLDRKDRDRSHRAPTLPTMLTCHGPRALRHDRQGLHAPSRRGSAARRPRSTPPWRRPIGRERRRGRRQLRATRSRGARHRALRGDDCPAPARRSADVRAAPEALPLGDGAFDAAMSVLSDHHWPDRVKGLREMRRIARRRVIVFQFEPAEFEQCWLVRDYLTTFRAVGVAELGGDRRARIEPVPIPHDCRDGFLAPTGDGRTPTSTRGCATPSRSSGCCRRATWAPRSSACALTSSRASGTAQRVHPQPG